MRHLSLIFLSFLLTACASTSDKGAVNQSDGSVFREVKKVEYKGTVFAKYLKDYLAKNLNPRSITSRNLIDRSGIESNGRLPSKALFQSLGYRVRDAFVALPPELSTRGIENPEAWLFTKEIQSMETTLALLDTTKARLKSEGGLEAGRQDWEVAITRRNLLLEAVGYWYQMRDQELYNQGLARLDRETNQIFEEIKEARQNFDVEDLREKELALLGLRTDSSLLFQFYSSEQARLYNRIDSRELSDKGRKTPRFTNSLSCSIDTLTDQQGRFFLESQYKSQVEKITQIDNRKVAIYELNQLSREIATKALAIRTKKLNAIEKMYLFDQAVAEKQRNEQLSVLKQKNLFLVEKGEDVNLQEIEVLEAMPLNIRRRPIVNAEESTNYYSAISVLESWVLNELVKLNQLRLENALVGLDSAYQIYQESVWDDATNDVRNIRDVLYEVYDYTLINYLIGYERVSFANKAISHRCGLDRELTSKSLKTNLKSIDRFADFIERNYEMGMPNDALQIKLANHKFLEKSLVSKKLDDRHQNVKSKAQSVLSRDGFSLATKDEALTFLKGDGYTVEVGEFSDTQNVLKMVKRFKRSVPKLIYFSTSNGQKNFKILIGQEDTLSSIEEMQERISFGEIKSFEKVRNDL